MCLQGHISSCPQVIACADETKRSKQGNLKIKSK
jgi:hypothetical protein